jgi:TonB family protein
MGRSGVFARWGLPGLASLAAHGALVAIWLLSGDARDRARGAQAAAPGPAVAVVELDLVPAAHAPPGPAASGPSDAAISRPSKAAARRSRVVRRPRRVAALVPPAPPIENSPVEPSKQPDHGEERSGEKPSGEAPLASAGALPSSAGGGGGPPTPSAAAPAPAREGPISPQEARYLRIYETYPRLPRSLWVKGVVYSVRVQICVSAEGNVDEVQLLQGAAPELDSAVVSTLRTWRYRPRMVDGQPRPFCHLMKIHYQLEMGAY